MSSSSERRLKMLCCCCCWHQNSQLACEMLERKKTSSCGWVKVKVKQCICSSNGPNPIVQEDLRISSLLKTSLVTLHWIGNSRIMLQKGNYQNYNIAFLFFTSSYKQHSVPLKSPTVICLIPASFWQGTPYGGWKVSIFRGTEQARAVRFETGEVKNI